MGGPGGIHPDSRPWLEVEKDYRFVSDFESLSARVTGEGSRERYDYWLKGFRMMRSMAELSCAWGGFEGEIKKTGAMTNQSERRKIAKSLLLPLRLEVVRATDEVYKNLLGRVSDSADFGAVMNWERLLDRLNRRCPQLTNYLGLPLPPEAQFRTTYKGETRLIVPVARTCVARNEPLTVRAVVLSESPVREVAVFWKPLAGREYSRVTLKCLGRGVYQGVIPGQADDFEYYVEMTSQSNAPLHFPVTAPRLNQTVVVEEDN
jgi:hypothetical protein